MTRLPKNFRLTTVGYGYERDNPLVEPKAEKWVTAEDDAAARAYTAARNVRTEMRIAHLKARIANDEESIKKLEKKLVKVRGVGLEKHQHNDPEHPLVFEAARAHEDKESGGLYIQYRDEKGRTVSRWGGEDSDKPIYDEPAPSMAEIRRLARMMDCPACGGTGISGYQTSKGTPKPCTFCGGDKIVERRVIKQMAREHKMDFEKYVDYVKAYGR